MRLLPRLWALLSSRRLSVWLIGLLVAGYVVWVVPFQVYGVPAWRTRNIASAWGFQVLGGLLLVNTTACLIAHSIRVVRRVRSGFGPSDEALQGPSATTFVVPHGAEETLARAAATLRRRGFLVTEDSGVVRAHKGRYSPIGTVISHAAILLLAVSVALTSFAYFSGKLVFVEGEGGDVSDRALYAEPTPSEMSAVPDTLLPKGAIELLTVEPGFWRDVQLFNKLEARLRIDGRSEKVRINHPVRIGSAWVAISGFGYAPEIRLKRSDGTSESFFVKLKVFPPGSIDRFELPDSPYRVDMKVFPDAAVQSGGVTNRTYNLRDPAVVLRVSDITQTSGSGSYEGTVRLGEPARFDGNDLRVSSIRYYAELRVVRNPGVGWFVAAALLGMVGLVMRFGFRQRVVLVSTSDTGDGVSKVSMVATAEHWHAGFSAVTIDVIRHALGAPVQLVARDELEESEMPRDETAE